MGAQVKAYLQGADGEEWVLEIRQPEPVSWDSTVDKTIFFPIDALNYIADKVREEEPETECWIRIIM